MDRISYENLGIHLDRHGRGCCPIHGGDSKSAFSLFERDGKTFWHCFVCNTGGGLRKLLRLLGMDDGPAPARPKRIGPRGYEVRKSCVNAYNALLDRWRRDWPIQRGDDIAKRYRIREGLIAEASDFFDEPTFANKIEFLDKVASGLLRIDSEVEYDLNLCRSEHTTGTARYEPLLPLRHKPCRAVRSLQKRIRVHREMLHEEPDPLTVLKYAVYAGMENLPDDDELEIRNEFSDRAGDAARILRRRAPDPERLSMRRYGRYPRCFQQGSEASAGGDGDRTRQDRDGDVAAVACRNG